jgi:hypothetical protein
MSEVWKEQIRAVLKKLDSRRISRMPYSIVSNNIPSPVIQNAVSDAVRDGIGERPGEWNVEVYQAPDCPELAVRIEGPKGLRWSWTFREQEQAPENIQQRVAQAILAKLLPQEVSASNS